MPLPKKDLHEMVAFRQLPGPLFVYQSLLVATEVSMRTRTLAWYAGLVRAMSE